MSMTRRPRLGPALVLLTLVTAGCGATSTDELAGPAVMASPTSSGQVGVSLWHCGVDPVVVDGRSWMADRSRYLWDATNVPQSSWQGRGTAEVTSDTTMTYTDLGGHRIDFVPDSGQQRRDCMQSGQPAQVMLLLTAPGEGRSRS